MIWNSNFWGNPRGDYCNCRGRFWLSAEYLNWRTRDQNVPPLITTSPDGTAKIDAGVLGVPSTGVLFDAGTLENNDRSGGRFTLGFWLPCYCDVGLEASYLFLGRTGQSFSTSSNGSPILARPLIDANTGAEISQLVAFPGLVSGSVAVDYSTRLWGLEANVRHKLCCGPCGFVDLIYGYRHMQLEDDVNISENLTAGGLGIAIQDSFATRNIFNGGQIGLEAERRLWRRFFVNGYAKAAFGVNHQIVNINGSTLFTAVAPGVANPQPAGILSLPTNSGQSSRDRFAIVPEFGLKVGWDINERWRIWAGYSALWLTDAVRAGEQIDRVVNRSQIPNNVTGIGPLVGQPRPLVPFQTQDFWAHGFNLGLEYRY
jgi:Putative beta barrel porin-7 (BBP7)